jgi:nicotinamide riboside kinase
MRDLENIAVEHNNLEDNVSSEDKDYVFVDTNIITTFSYALYYFGNVSPLLTNILISSLYKYKYLFLCDEDIPFDDTPDRSGPESRNKIQKINKMVLERYKLKYTILYGPLERRVENIRDYIQKGNR